MKIEPILQKTAIFQSFTSPVLQEIIRYSNKRNFDKGQELFSIGDPADGFFVILSGWVKLYRMSREGEETIIHVFGPGESFAEAAVFSEHQTYPVSAQAVDTGSLIEIPRSYLMRKIQEDSRFALCMLGAISARQHYLVQQLEQVTSRAACQRVGAFLLRFCRASDHVDADNAPVVVNLPYDKSVISKRLNIKAETFSRALNQLKPYGVVSDRRGITIKTPDVLAEFCDFEDRGKPC